MIAPLGASLPGVFLAPQRGLLAATSASSDAAQPSSAGWIWWLVAVAAAVILTLAVRAAAQWRDRRRRYSRRGLFTGLCAAHGLDRARKGLLQEIGRQQALDQPARVFTEPQWLTQAATSPAWADRRRELQGLIQLLFDADGPSK